MILTHPKTIWGIETPQSLPATFFINPNGEVVFASKRPIDATAIEQRATGNLPSPSFSTAYTNSLIGNQQNKPTTPATTRHLFRGSTTYASTTNTIPSMTPSTATSSFRQHTGPTKPYSIQHGFVAIRNDVRSTPMNGQMMSGPTMWLTHTLVELGGPIQGPTALPSPSCSSITIPYRSRYQAAPSQGKYPAVLPTISTNVEVYSNYKRSST